MNTQRNVRGPCTVIIIPIFNNSSGNLHMILNCLYARSTEYARGAVQWYVSGTRAPNWCKIDKSIWFVHAQMVTWNIIFHNKTRNCKDKTYTISCWASVGHYNFIILRGMFVCTTAYNSTVCNFWCVNYWTVRIA